VALVLWVDKVLDLSLQAQHTQHIACSTVGTLFVLHCDNILVLTAPHSVRLSAAGLQRSVS
jgi:hypothetical protein